MIDKLLSLTTGQVFICILLIVLYATLIFTGKDGAEMFGPLVGMGVAWMFPKSDN